MEYRSHQLYIREYERLEKNEMRYRRRKKTIILQMVSRNVVKKTLVM